MIWLLRDMDRVIMRTERRKCRELFFVVELNSVSLDECTKVMRTSWEDYKTPESWHGSCFLPSYMACPSHTRMWYVIPAQTVPFN